MPQISDLDKELALIELSFVREYAMLRLNALPTVATLAATMVAFLVTTNSIPKLIGTVMICILVILVPLSLWRQLHEVNEAAKKSKRAIMELVPEVQNLLESSRSVNFFSKLYLNSLETILVCFTLICIGVVIFLVRGLM